MAEHNVTYEITANTAGVADVTFTCGNTGLTHSRQVNVHDLETDGIAERLTSVAKGVENKMALGVIAEPADAAEAEDGDE